MILVLSIPKNRKVIQADGIRGGALPGLFSGGSTVVAVAVIVGVTAVTGVTVEAVAAGVEAGRETSCAMKGPMGRINHAASAMSNSATVG